MTVASRNACVVLCGKQNGLATPHKRAPRDAPIRSREIPVAGRGLPVFEEAAAVLMENRLAVNCPRADKTEFIR